MSDCTCDSEQITEPTCAPFRNVLEDHHVPARGRYQNALVEDTANAKFYFYDACGAYAELISSTGGGGGGGDVTSVNGEVGDVILGFADVGAVGVDTVFINVKDHGAIGDNVHNDTANIQAAIDLANSRGGGIVFLPAGIYKLTTPLIMHSAVTLMGVGRGVLETDTATIIKQTGNNQDGIQLTDTVSCRINNLCVEGTGSGTGIGINFNWTTAIPFFHNMTDVTVRGFGATGIKGRTVCVSNFTNVFSTNNGEHGFWWPEGGTSCTFSNTWARNNAKAGYRWEGSVYHNLSSAAGDFNGVTYEIIDSQSICFSGCGSEFASRNGGAYNGTSWRIDNSAWVTLASCWVTGNHNIAIEVINTAQAAWLGVVDNSPSMDAVYFIQTEAGTLSNIPHMYNSSPNNISPGTAHILNDGGGSFLPVADQIMNNNRGLYWRNAADDASKLVLFVGNDDITGVRSGGGGLQLKRSDNVAIVSISEGSDQTDFLGDLHLENNKSIVWRNAADSADKVVLALGNTDNVVLKGAGGNIYFEKADGTEIAHFDETAEVLSMNSNQIQQLADPSGPQHAMTKNYADGHYIHWHTGAVTSATDPGVAGEFTYDGSFIYVCVATNTWKRVAIATW